MRFRHKILWSISLATLLCSCDVFSPTYAVEGESQQEEVTKVNDLKGDYLIATSSDARDLIMIDGDYDQGDGYDKPKIKRTNNSTYFTYDNPLLDTKTFFSIYPIVGVSHQGYQSYYISSPGDAASRIDCVNGDFEAGNLWFFKEKSTEPTVSNICQQIHIEKDGYCYRFFFFNKEGSHKYYMSYASDTISLVRDDQVKDPEKISFILHDVPSQKSIATSLNICTGARYDVNSIREVQRTVENIEPKKGAPKFSKPFTFGISNSAGVDQYTDTSFRKHFHIPYYSNDCTLNASFVYQSWHHDFQDFVWAKDMKLQARENSVSWYLDTMVNFLGEGDSNGSFVVQKKVDEAWQNIYVAPYVDGNYTSKMSLNWSQHLSTSETAFCVYFAYTISNYRGDHRDVILLSDEFYLAYSGVDINNNFLPVLVAPIKKEEQASSEKGLGETITNETYVASFQNGKQETLLPNSLVQHGFSAKPLLQGYRASIRHEESGQLITVNYGQSQDFVAPGKYTITVENIADPTQKSTHCLYVAEENLAHTFFGKPFSIHDGEYNDDDPYFVIGQRTALGYSNEELGIPSDSRYPYPVYVGAVTIQARKFLSYASAFKASLYRNDEEIDSYEGQLPTLHLQERGDYRLHMDILFNEKCGIRASYDLRFHIIDEVFDSSINVKLLNHATHEAYDLLPVVYAVPAEYGPIAKDDVFVEYLDEQGKTKHALRKKYVVFSSYDSAYRFALGKLRNLLFEHEGNYVYYEGVDENNKDIWITLSEYQAYRFIAERAQSMIFRTYLTQEDMKDLQADANEIRYSYQSYEEIPSRYLVTTNAQELERLSMRDLINHYQFIQDKDGLVSSSIALYDEAGNLIDDAFPYFTKVEDYMKERGLPSGKYTFVDTAPGQTSTIVRSYIIPFSEDHNYLHATTNIASLSGEKTAITMDNVQKSYSFSGGFVIENIVNPYDSRCLLVVTKPNGEEEFLSSHEVASLRFLEEGIYHIRVRDRVYNFYEFDVEVRP